MLKPVESYDGIYLACGFTDLRKSVDGLAALVKHDFGLDPFGNSLFLFCNKGRNRLKCLNWDTNGFILYYKRLDGQGAKFMWPREQQDVRDIRLGNGRTLGKVIGELLIAIFCIGH